MDVLDFRLPPLRDLLPEDALQAFHARARRVRFSDGQSLHARGDEAARLCMVAEGAVRLGRFQPGGAFNLVAMVGPGGHFGEVGVQRTAHTHDGFAAGVCEIDIIDTAAMEDLLTHQPGFALALWRTNTSRLNALLELYDDARTLGVPTRLAKMIYVHAGRGALADGVACRQRDLAELLGASQVSVGNALKELEKAGLVEAGYRCVRVPDRAKLKAWLRKSAAT